MGRILLLFLFISGNVFGQSDTIKAECLVPQKQECRIVLRCGGTITTSNAPLIVVDGLICDSIAFKQIKPESIISIDILRGSVATALYGCSLGAHDVIIITTKRSKNLIIEDADSKKELEGVNVKVQLSDNSKNPLLFVSDLNGEVDLSSLQVKQYELELSCIGYKTRKVTVNEKALYRRIKLEKEYKIMQNVTIEGQAYSRKISCGFSCSYLVENKDSTNGQDLSSSITVYPNPVFKSGTITIRSSELSPGKIDLVSSSGQIMHSQSITGKDLTSVRMNLNLTTAGIYFIRFTGKETQRSFTQKIIVQ